MDTIRKHFPDLTSQQYQHLERLYPLYEDWNSKINLISRKDFENFFERHVLHSLSIGLFYQFQPNSRLLDVGTGGGFPGIPLAILFPECKFSLIDSIAKKIKVVEDVAAQLRLDNVDVIRSRVEEENGQYDFILSRAVTELPKFWKWTKKNISSSNNNNFPNGILYLKGGDVYSEAKITGRKFKIHHLGECFESDFFETKKLVHIF